MVRGNAPKGQTGETTSALRSTAKGTLLVGDVRLTDIRQKPRMGRPASSKVLTGLAQTELSVHCQADFGGVFVVQAVIFPPANRAQRERACRFKCFISTAWAAKKILHGCLAWMDVLLGHCVYAGLYSQAWATINQKPIRIGTGSPISHERPKFHRSACQAGAFPTETWARSVVTQAPSICGVELPPRRNY
jgi:hypothetical protein